MDAVHAVRCDPTVEQWWGAAERSETVDDLRNAEPDQHFFVIECDGEVAGGIQYFEEPGAQFHYAAIDIFLGSAWQGRGLGREAIELLIGYLVRERGHHRITIDPASANERAVRCYAAVGFRVVGTLREYQLMDDGTRVDATLMELVVPGAQR